MSSSSSPNLVLELPRSWLRHLPALLLLSAALSLPWFASSWSPLTRALTAITGLVLATTELWRTGFFHSGRHLSRVSWHQDQFWHLQFGDDQPVPANLLGRSWYSPWVMCLKFKTETSARVQLLLWRNEVTRQIWHQWTLRLRQEGGKLPKNADGSLDSGASA